MGQKFQPIQPGIVRRAPQGGGGHRVVPAVQVQADGAAAHAVAHQTQPGRVHTVGHPHIGNGGGHVSADVRKGVGRERFLALTAAGKVHGDAGNACMGQPCGQRAKVAVAAPAAGKAVAEHHQRPARTLGRRGHGGVYRHFRAVVPGAERLVPLVIALGRDRLRRGGQGCGGRRLRFHRGRCAAARQQQGQRHRREFQLRIFHAYLLWGGYGRGA